MRPILRSPSLKLIEDGHVNRKNLRAEMLTEDELMSQLREQGVEHVSGVKRARLDGDGRLSVIKREE